MTTAAGSQNRRKTRRIPETEMGSKFHTDQAELRFQKYTSTQKSVPKYAKITLTY